MLGREGREGAVEVVVVAGLTAEGEVVVMAVEAAGLPAVGREVKGDPAHPSSISIRGKSETRWKMVDGGDDSLGWSPLNGCLGGDETRGDREAGRLTTSSCSLPGFGRRHRRHNRNQPCIGASPGNMGKMMDLGTATWTGGGIEWRWIDGFGGWAEKKGKVVTLQVACGREWRSRGCRRLPTAGEVGEGQTKYWSTGVQPSALRLWTRSRRVVPRHN